jgi:hypothetical protein
MALYKHSGNHTSHLGTWNELTVDFTYEADLQHVCYVGATSRQRQALSPANAQGMVH